MRSSSSEDEDVGLLRQRRNARSLDIDRSCRTSREASKAAAWMWHMHSSPSSKTKEIKEKPASPSDYTKRRSTSCDRKDSRFRQEATASASTSTPKPVTDQSPSCKLEQEANVWDCGSKLYDTFELVSFSNRLDRSLLDIPAFNALNYPPAQSPLHHRGFAGVLRTFSLPRTLSKHNYSSMPTVLPPPPHVKPPSHVVGASTLKTNETSSSAIRKHSSPADLQGTVAASATRIDRKPSASWHVITNKWTLSKLTNILKKVKTLHKHIQCFRPRAVGSHDIRRHELMDDEDGNGMPELKYRTYEEKVNEGNGGKHFHHHHHHYHHHFVHHNIDQLSPAAKEENVCKPRASIDRNGSTCAVRFGQRAESARLSSDTLFKICADVNWL